MLSNSHIPCITRPTRITKSTATLIDNILVSHDIYSSINCGIAISDVSNHFPCIITWPNIIKNKKNSLTFDTKKLDENFLPDIKNELTINWNQFLLGKDVNESYQLFHTKLTSTLNKFTEEKKIKIPYKKIIKEPWLTKGIIKSNKKQLCLYNEWLQNKTAENYDRYKHYRNALHIIKRHCKVTYYNTQCERYKQNSKRLWKIINDICGKINDKSTSISFLSVDGIKQYDSEKISNEFAKFFSSIGARYSQNIPKSDESVNTYLNKIKRNKKSIFLTPCTEYEIRKIIMSLKNKKSSGHDGISNIFLKELVDVIAHPLYLIFNNSLQTGVFPNLMKCADDDLCTRMATFT